MARSYVLSAILSAVAFSPMFLQAQVLEEIVVTAQRRTQSLQEVPISIEAFSGVQLREQGYRNLGEMAQFSASVDVEDDDTLSQSRKIRGFGTTGNALTLEQSVPIFVDGIHFGRPAQVKTAFLDVERVEVLKGPQPVFFGMNAVAGAFNIQTANPTPEWEGYVDSEYGNNRNAKVEGAFGGPLTDTIGFRAAGMYESDAGYLEDVITGSKFPYYRNVGGRMTLQWTPADNLQATVKLEATNLDKDAEAPGICLTPGSLIYERNNPANPSDEGNERSVWADPPKGEGWDQAHTVDEDCDSNKGVWTGVGGPYYQPPVNAAEENSFTGMIDIRDAGDFYMRNFTDNPTAKGVDTGMIGFEAINTWSTNLDVSYTLDNGIELNSKSAYSNYYRHYTRDNSRSPFLLNIQNRMEKLDQWSQEIRFSSPSGGTIEWMGGVFYQIMDSDMVSNSPRGHVGRGLRLNHLWEDQEWLTAFGTVTYNFLDNRASIDVGARYSDLSKTGHVRGVGANWVYDVFPCPATPGLSGDRTDYLDDDGGGNPDPATCGPVPDEDSVQITEADTMFLLPGADTTNLWTTVYSAGNRITPASWRGPRADAIGLTIPDPSVVPGPYTEDFSSGDINPSVTLRYRPTDDISVFARWAQATKAGGFDTGVSSINSSVEAFRFEPEDSETFEFGVKGTLWDNRVRYDATLFRQVFQDLQVSISTGDPDDPFLNVNAGEMRVQGLEFGAAFAASEQLTLTLQGALMDGKYTFFPNAGCSTAERTFFEASGCDPDTGRIDRTGDPTPDSPNYKIVLGANYWMPVLSAYRVSLNARGYISADPNSGVAFNPSSTIGTHGDMNLAVGFGPQDETWEVSVFGRNFLEPRSTYHPELDLNPSGISTPGRSSTAFFSYGAKFRYNFF